MFDVADNPISALMIGVLARGLLRTYTRPTLNILLLLIAYV